MNKFVSILLLTLTFGLSSFAQITVEAVGMSNVETLADNNQYVSGFFGNVTLNMSSYSRWVITNSGDEEIQLLKTRLNGMMYSGTTTCKKVLAPKAKCDVQIRFSPFTEGYHTGYLDMIFDKGGNIYFDFWGYGVK